MEKLENLFEKGSYDSKNILNRSDKVIPESTLNLIEGEGASIELLETLGVPVFKYRTQITIHGLFPELKNNYIGGYRNMFQNKNLSIGVKYNAIDVEKKKIIYHFLRHKGWSITRNSTDWYASQAIPVNKDNYKEEFAKMKELVKDVDTSLFYGNCEVFLGKTMFGVFVFAQIIIQAVPAKNMENLVINLTGKTIAENQNEIAEKDAEIERKRQVEHELHQKYLAERRERLLPYIQKVKEQIENEGWVWVEKHPITENLLVMTFHVDEEKTESGYEYKNSFKFEIFVKEPRQKKFRSQYEYKKELNAKLNFYGSGIPTSKTAVTGYIKPEPKKVQETPVPQSTETIKGDFRIVDYSEKAVAVYGNTKPIKEKLSAMGGRFNFRLAEGPGWIFPKTKKDELIKTLGL